MVAALSAVLTVKLLPFFLNVILLFSSILKCYNICIYRAERKILSLFHASELNPGSGQLLKIMNFSLRVLLYKQGKVYDE